MSDSIRLSTGVVTPPVDLNDYVAWIRTTGLQRNNRFFVNFAFPEALGLSSTDASDTMLACEEFRMAARSIETKTLRLNGLDEQRAHSVNYGSTFSLSFLVDARHTAHRTIEKWMELQVDPWTREVAEYTEYARPMELWFLRPYTAQETYQALDRPTNSVDKFFEQTKQRVLSIASTAVSNAKQQIQNKVYDAKASMLGKQLGLYNRIRGAIPIQTLFDEPTGTSDYVMYQIAFEETFPVSIYRTPMTHMGRDVLRLDVTFAFKRYVSNTSSPMPPKSDTNAIMTFIRNAGIPTSPRQLGREIFNLL